MIEIKVLKSKSNMVMQDANLSSLVIFIFFIIQCVLVSYSFPLKELFTEKPLFYIDNAYHWYFLNVFKFLKSEGLHTVYDPFFNAGTASGLGSYPSGHLPQLLTLMLCAKFSTIVIWKLSVFFMACVGPIFPGIALGLLKFDWFRIGIGLCLSIFMWWTGYFHWFFVAGMVSYVFAVFYSIFVIALLFKYRNSKELLPKAIVIISGAVLVFLHPLSIIPVFFWVLSYHIVNVGEFYNGRIIFFLFLFFCLSVILNSWWLILHFSDMYDQGLSMVSYQAKIKFKYILPELLGIWRGNSYGAKSYTLFFVLSLISLFTKRFVKERRLLFSSFLAFFLIQLYAALAGKIEILALLTQPNRYAPAGYLLLLFPAVQSLPSASDFLNYKNIKLKLVSLYIIPALIAAFCTYELVREVTYGEHGRYATPPPYVKGTGEYSEFILDSLTKYTDCSARVLFETSKRWVHDGGHLAGYYAATSNREFIGGPYTYQYFAGFWDGFLFNSPIQNIPQRKFIKYLKLYNIGWVIVHSTESKNFLDELEMLEKGPSFRELQFYKVDIEHSFFEKGEGSITGRGYNRIKVEKSNIDHVILKYHYIPNLKVKPYGDIEPVALMDDPIPFISLKNVPSKFTIYLDP